MRSFLDGLDPGDEEHGAAWVADDKGNSLEYEVSGNLCLARGDTTRHLSDVPKERVVELWLCLANGRIDMLEREAWEPGTRPRLSGEGRAERDRATAEWQLVQDREFYERLGVEREGIRCRKSACSRGAVAFSVFCKAHHFENMHDRPCPFDD